MRSRASAIRGAEAREVTSQVSTKIPMTPVPLESPAAPVTVVGIGASAGGLHALQRFFGSLGDETGVAYVVIVHLDRHFKSQMAELLQTSTRLPVSQVSQSVAIEAGHVYIIPPDKDLASVDGHLELTKRLAAVRSHAPIDQFFRTLAETHHANAVGIILSGTGSDGTQGIRWIKEHGGITMAQTPTDAEYADMPLHAIATGQVDVVSPATALATELTRLRRAASTMRVPEDGASEPTDDAAVVAAILTHVRSRTGHDFSGYKAATVLRRIHRRMQLLGAESLTGYAGMLRDNPKETSALFNDFLVAVTSFFRDPKAIEALNQQVIPALFANKSHDASIRVWVAGCATGEEAYTLAMLLLEHAEQLDEPPHIQIFATDVNEIAFGHAREGCYPASIAADILPARLKRFFVPETGAYRISKAVRDTVLFANHNLLKDPPFLNLDLVSCRNVLIYLQPEAQQRVLELFHYGLRPGGYLFLGCSESRDTSGKLFSTVDKRERIFRSITGAERPAPRVPSAVFGEPHSAVPMTQPRHTSSVTFGALHQRLLEAYAPPSLIVNSEEEIVHLSDTVGRFLRHGGGVPTTKLLDLVDDKLCLELRILLRAALRSGKPGRSPAVAIALDGVERYVSIRVRPLRPEPPDNGVPTETFVLVVFEEQRDARARRRDTGEHHVNAATVTDLEQVLKDTREELASAVEEHETTVEELRASNEEFQSITEEQKAVAEELETSKEELQSINEELRTVNQEHRIRNDELAQANSDLANLIDSTEIATLFLARDLTIRRYTPAIADLFNIVPTDCGRPLSHLTHRLHYEDVEADVLRVSETRVRFEREVTHRDGRWFTVCLSPYRSHADKIDGVVLTFVDTTTRKRAELDREALLRAVQDTSVAKSNFIGVMSHEFRTPLNAILGYADILEAGAVGPVTVDQRAQLERIQANARHLARVVDEILESTRFETQHAIAKWGSADMTALVHEVATLIAPLAMPKNLSFTVEAPDAPTPMITDATMVRRILFNLLGNAVRFTDHGGIVLRMRAHDAMVTIEIADTGIGIAPENLARVFDRFWQADQTETRLRGGTGLGLMVSRSLAEALGGRIEVESELGRGSTFRIQLPCDGVAREPAGTRGPIGAVEDAISRQ